MARNALRYTRHNITSKFSSHFRKRQ